MPPIWMDIAFVIYLYMSNIYATFEFCCLHQSFIWLDNVGAQLLLASGSVFSKVSQPSF